MRGYSIMSDEERESILSQHQTIYNGYAVKNVTSNMTPLTVGDYAMDKGGITINNNGEVSHYKNHKINETKELDETNIDFYEDITNDIDLSNVDSAYDFESEGPEEFEMSSDDMDPYDSDLEMIQNMFDFEDIYGSDNDSESMIGMMNNDFDGKEKMRSEKSAFNFKPKGSDDSVFGEEDMSVESDDDVCEQCGEMDEMDEMDEDLKESFKKEKEKITEMFNRFKNFN